MNSMIDPALRLPSGDLEIFFDGKWSSICMTDALSEEEIRSYVKPWTRNHNITGIRYSYRSRITEYPVE